MKVHFLNDLKEALEENNMPRDVINNNVVYYDKYITEKLKKGVSIEDVINELGSGRLIAKTIIDAEKKGAKSSYYNSTGFGNTSSGFGQAYTSGNNNSTNNKSNVTKFSSLMENTSLKTKVKTILIVALIIALIVMVVVFTFKLIMFLIPFIAVMFVLGLIIRFIFHR